jgi:thioredoxin 1
MNKKITELNYINFEDFLKDKVVLVEFWAEWCHPCKLQNKILEELAQENQGFFEIAKLNVDDNKVVSSKLGVRNIPTLILYVNGKEERRIIGLNTKEMLQHQLTNAIKTKKTA